MFYLGLDLGKSQDHTAIAVVERPDAGRAWQTSAHEQLLLRYIERVPLGTPYPAVVEHVRRIVQHEQTGGRCTLAVDATGVGAPSYTGGANSHKHLNKLAPAYGEKRHAGFTGDRTGE